MACLSRDFKRNFRRDKYAFSRSMYIAELAVDPGDDRQGGNQTVPQHRYDGRDKRDNPLYINALLFSGSVFFKPGGDLDLPAKF